MTQLFTASFDGLPSLPPPPAARLLCTTPPTPRAHSTATSSPSSSSSRLPHPAAHTVNSKNTPAAAKDLQCRDSARSPPTVKRLSSAGRLSPCSQAPRLPPLPPRSDSCSGWRRGLSVLPRKLYHKQPSLLTQPAGLFSAYARGRHFREQEAVVDCWWCVWGAGVPTLLQLLNPPEAATGPIWSTKSKRRQLQSRV